MANDYKQEYIQRQLQLMTETLTYFEKQKISFYELVNTLDALISALIEYDEDLSDTLRSEWWDLEQINAALLDEEGELSMSEIQKKEIFECLKNIKKMISNKTNH